MLDAWSSRSADSHDDVWALIPWYVNGTLPADERERVKRHIRMCPECAAEVARQHGLAKQVLTSDPFEPPLSRSWEKLRAQIEPTGLSPSRQVKTRRWFEGLRGGLIVTGALVAASFMIVVWRGPPNENFRTLTSNAPDSQYTIKFQTVPNLDAKAIEGLLAKQGLTLVGGPSEAGVYTATAKPGSNIAEAAKALMAAPGIVFAAPGQ